MPRGYSASVIAAYQATRFRPFHLVRAVFDTGTERWWTRAGRDLTWDSQTWKAAGRLLDIVLPDEQAQPQSSACTVTLSGIDSVHIAEARGTPVANRELTVWKGFLDDANAVIPDPIIVYAGLMDYLTVQREESTIAVTIQAEHPEILMARASGRLRTHGDQAARHGGDRFFSHTARLPDTPLVSPGKGWKPD